MSLHIMHSNMAWRHAFLVGCAIGISICILSVAGCDKEESVSAPPAPPDSISARAYDTSTIQVTWSAVPGVQVYEVIWLQNADTVGVRRVGNTTLFISKLTPGTFYDIDVYSVKGSQKSDPKSTSATTDILDLQPIVPDKDRGDKSAKQVNKTQKNKGFAGDVANLQTQGKAPADSLLATVPAAPSGLTATAASTSQINLSWTDNSGNESGFIIERTPADVAVFVILDTVTINQTTFRDINLMSGRTYMYRLQAYNAAGLSALSNTVQVSTQNNPVIAALVSQAWNFSWHPQNRWRGTLTFQQVNGQLRGSISYTPGQLTDACCPDREVKNISVNGTTVSFEEWIPDSAAGCQCIHAGKRTYRARLVMSGGLDYLNGSVTVEGWAGGGLYTDYTARR